MARQRDYKAEERRRNDKARAAGFTSRAQQRRATEQAREWSREHSRQPASELPARASAELVRDYRQAFINKGERWSKRLASMRKYLVDDRGIYTDEEFDDLYGDI